MDSLHFWMGYTQDATYWQLGSVDGFGKRSFITPVVIKVKWSDRTDLVISRQGESIPSRAVVFVKQDVQVGEYLALGNHVSTTDPISLPTAAFQILEFRKDTSMMGDDTFRQAIL